LYPGLDHRFIVLQRACQVERLIGVKVGCRRWEYPLPVDLHDSFRFVEV
jgi:hypothetical protein